MRWVKCEHRAVWDWKLSKAVIRRVATKARHHQEKTLCFTRWGEGLRKGGSQFLFSMTAYKSARNSALWSCLLLTPSSWWLGKSNRTELVHNYRCGFIGSFNMSLHSLPYLRVAPYSLKNLLLGNCNLEIGWERALLHVGGKNKQMWV